MDFEMTYSLCPQFTGTSMSYSLIPSWGNDALPCIFNHNATTYIFLRLSRSLAPPLSLSLSFSLLRLLCRSLSCSFSFTFTLLLSLSHSLPIFRFLILSLSHPPHTSPLPSPPSPQVYDEIYFQVTADDLSPEATPTSLVCSAHSPGILPVQWSLKHGVGTERPGGYAGQDFDWADYLKHSGTEAAPDTCFPDVRGVSRHHVSLEALFDWLS